MNSIADALVYAVTYINLRATEEDADDDVRALESIVAMLHDASKEEEDALAAGAQRALEAETNGPARAEFIQDYSTWMDDMFGEDWIHNQRSQ